MISPARPARTVRAGGAVLAAVVLLSGCSGLRPGTAVEVGDEQITTSDVDAVTTQFCAALEKPLNDQAQSVPLGYFRSGIAGVLALREAAEQVAAEYDVDAESDEAYLQQLSDLRDQVADLPETQREAVIRVESAPFYVQAVQTAIGEELLDGEGEDTDFEAAGAEELQRWIDDNGVEFDPAFNTTISDSAVTQSDQSLSFAVSEGAKAGQEASPNSALAAELPDAQRCGR